MLSLAAHVFCILNGDSSNAYRHPPRGLCRFCSRSDIPALLFFFVSLFRLWVPSNHFYIGTSSGFLFMPLVFTTRFCFWYSDLSPLPFHTLHPFGWLSWNSSICFFFRTPRTFAFLLRHGLAAFFVGFFIYTFFFSPYRKNGGLQLEVLVVTVVRPDIVLTRWMAVMFLILPRIKSIYPHPPGLFSLLKSSPNPFKFSSGFPVKKDNLCLHGELAPAGSGGMLRTPGAPAFFFFFLLVAHLIYFAHFSLGHSDLYLF